METLFPYGSHTLTDYHQYQKGSVFGTCMLINEVLTLR